MNEQYVVVTGVTGSNNRGVEALVRSFIEGFRKISDLRVYVASYDPQYDCCVFDDSNVIVSPAPSPYPLKWKRKLRNGILSVLRRTKHQEFSHLVKGASCVIAIGGDVFSSDYGGPEKHLAPLRLAVDHGVPFAIFGHSVGPFSTKAEVDSWLEVSQKAALITLREHSSHRYLIDTLAQQPDNIKVTADLAFLLEPTWSCDTGDWASCYGFDSSKPLIGVGPSQGISHFKGLDREAHFKAWYKTIVYLLKNMKAQVILIPHVQASNHINNDLYLAQKLLNKTGHLGRIRIASFHSATDYKGIVSECDLIISERMHVCIAGLGSCVPTHAIGYSVKAKGILLDLLGESMLEQFLTPVENFVKGDEFLQKLPMLLEGKDKTEIVLKSKITAYKNLAEHNFHLLKGVLN